jgi:putative ABC transport system permease protein
MRALKIAGMALGGLRRTPLRTALTALGVAIASAALVTLVAFALGLQRQVETPFRMLALLNNIQVSPKDDGGAAPVDDAALARMGQLPGVAAAYPDIRVQGIHLRHGDKTAVGIGLGTPREISLFGVEQDLIVAGRFFRQDDQPEAVLGTQLIGNLGFASPEEALDKTVTLEAVGLASENAKSFTVERKQLAVRVVGVYRAPPLLPGPARQGVLLPIDLMKEVPGVRFQSALNAFKLGASAASAGYESATVRVSDPLDLDAVEKQIQEMGYKTRTVLSRLRHMRTFFLVLQVLLASVGTVALVVAALGIINTLLMSVLERYQEIGIYKAIGASDGDVFVLFLTEAAVLGLLGSLGGLLFGWLVSQGIEFGVNVYAQTRGVEDHLTMFAFPSWLLASNVAFTTALSVATGVYPAFRAARVDPIRALRRD